VILGLSILIAASILAVPLFQIATELYALRKAIMAGITEVNAALDQLDTSIAALAAAVGGVQAPPDLQPIVDRITGERAQVDAQTVALGGTAPPGP